MRWGNSGPRSLVAAAATLCLVVGVPGVAQATSWDEADDAPIPGARPNRLWAENAYEAQLIAFDLGVAVEDLSQRTSTTRVWALPDGSWRTDSSLGSPDVLVAGDGTSPDDWRPVDLTLAVADDGLVRPAVVADDVWLAAGGENTDVVISTPVGGSEVTVQLVWKLGYLPPVELEGERAIYRDVWRDVDMVIDVLPQGFELYYIAETPQAAQSAAELGMTLRAVDGRVTSLDDGSLVVEDNAGATVAAFPTAFAWDARADEKHPSPVLEPWSAETNYADPPALERPYPNPALAEHAKDSQAYDDLPEMEPFAVESSFGPGAVHARFAVDEQWLSDPATTFPVIIDPAMQMAYRDSSFDTYVRNGGGANSTYYSSTEILVGTYNAGASGTVHRGYIRFLPKEIHAEEIESAELVIYLHHSWNCSSSPRTWRVYDSQPPGTSTTWNNQPTWLSGPSDTSETWGNSNCGEGGGWASPDITPIIQQWADGDGSSKGLAIKAKSEGASSYWKRFYSANKSSSYTPYIRWIGNSRPNTPADVTLGGVAGSEDSGSPQQVIGVIPVLSAKVSDDEGGAVRGLFTIYEDSVQIVTKAEGSLAASGSWSILDPQIELKPGSVYQVDVWSYDESAESEESTTVYWAVDADGVAVSLDDLPTNCDTEFDAVVPPPTPTASPSASPSPNPSPSWNPACVESAS